MTICLKTLPKNSPTNKPLYFIITVPLIDNYNPVGCADAKRRIVRDLMRLPTHPTGISSDICKPSNDG